MSSKSGNLFCPQDKWLQQLMIRVRVKNKGCVAATSFSVALYVNKSYNATYSKPIEGFPPYTVRRLNSSAVETVDFSWTPMEDGFFRVKVAVDENNDIPEIDEGNNVYSYPDEVKAGEPGYRAKDTPLPVPLYEKEPQNRGIIYEPHCEYVCPDPYTNKSYDYPVDFDINLPQTATVELARLYLYVYKAIKWTRNIRDSVLGASLK